MRSAQYEKFIVMSLAADHQGVLSRSLAAPLRCRGEQLVEIRHQIVLLTPGSSRDADSSIIQSAVCQIPGSWVTAADCGRSSGFMCLFVFCFCGGLTLARKETEQQLPLLEWVWGVEIITAGLEAYFVVPIICKTYYLNELQLFLWYWKIMIKGIA